MITLLIILLLNCETFAEDFGSIDYRAADYNPELDCLSFDNADYLLLRPQSACPHALSVYEALKSSHARSIGFCNGILNSVLPFEVTTSRSSQNCQLPENTTQEPNEPWKSYTDNFRITKKGKLSENFKEDLKEMENETECQREVASLHTYQRVIRNTLGRVSLYAIDLTECAAEKFRQKEAQNTLPSSGAPNSSSPSPPNTPSNPNTPNLPSLPPQKKQ